MTATNGCVDRISDDTPKSDKRPRGVEADHADSQVVPAEGDKDDIESEVFQLTVNLPHEPYKLQIIVSSQEAIQDVRQSIIETPQTFQYSCFHLEHKGKRVNDFVQISEVDSLVAGSELRLVEDPYTEKDARAHVVRIRELIGAAADRVDTVHGILAGCSLHDSIGEGGNTPEGSRSTRSVLSDHDFRAAGALSDLLPRPQEPPPKTLKSISVSPWNPPPYHLRQKGHLLYLQITTNEGDQYHITSHVSGFYVNKCSNSKFDPSQRAAPKSHSAHSLLTLISDVSLSFQSRFHGLIDFNNMKEPLASLQITNAIPSTPWAVPSPSSPSVMHHSDITRTQESYLLTGMENTENLRDWNEEFQSTRELPKDSVQDRVFRERLTSKLFADYNDAASRGAVMVARDEVPPLNPTEAKDAQIFVYNNIFFSFGADGVGTFASEGGDEAARVATGKDVMGVQLVNQLDIDGLYTPGTVVVDYLGKRIVGQSIVPGIFKQRDPEENQIDYGAVDGRDVIASDEKFVPVFKKLSKALKVKKHAVWDKSGKRYELEGSVETKGLLGTDGRKYVLDLYRITPLDILWMEENGTSLAVDAAHTNGVHQPAYPHRMTVLRPELIELYWKVKLRAWANEQLKSQNVIKTIDDEEKVPAVNGKLMELLPAESDKVNGTQDGTSKTSDEVNSEGVSRDKIDISEFDFSLNPDVFSGQEPQTEEDKDIWRQDQKEVRQACEYLRSVVIKELVVDLEEGELGFPMDGQSLSRLLHKRGINIRYLGTLASLATIKKMEALRALTIQTMISRAFKHLSAKYLRHLPSPLAGACVSHLLNCLLGTHLNATPKAEIDGDLASLYSDARLDFQRVTPTTLRKNIENQVELRFRYIMEEDWFTGIKHMQLLRDICLKLGLQIEAKDYCFPTPSVQNSTRTPSTNGNKESNTNGHGINGKKKKKTRHGSPLSVVSGGTIVSTTFHPDDLLNIVPIVKEASPRSVLAEEALEAGRGSIMQDQKKLGQELLLESLSLHEQIYGLLHPEVARVYNSLSMLYYQLDEKDAAIELARKAVVVSERTLGLDHSETLLNYLNLSLISHACGETSHAVLYVRHALNLWKIVYGPNHPDSITTINNAAVMLQNLKDYHTSRIWFEASLAICSDIYGRHSINAATLLFQLAQALALDSNSKAAVHHMRESYNVFLAELGSEDKNTKEAEKWLEQLTQNAVSIARHAKDLQARGARLRVMPRKVSMNAGQTSQVVGQRTGTSATGRIANGELDKRSIDELIRFIESADKNGAHPTKKRVGRRGNPKRRGGAASVVAK